MIEAVLRRLEQALQAQGPGALAFDADGTLWSGDVGEDAFLHAIAHAQLRDAALEGLQALARSFSLPLLADPNRQAESLYAAYHTKQLPERQACEMMAWAFAGWSEHELRAWVPIVMTERALSKRLFTPLHAVLGWARAQGLPTLVISASPDFVIHEAAKAFDFQPESIAACSPARSGGVLADYLQGPLPYLDQKVHAARRLSPHLPLLAAFGDNSFDVPLLKAARVAVAVRPKAALLSQLDQIPDVLVLEDSAQ